VANNLLTISQITNEGLMVLENETVFSGKVQRQYADEFAVTGAKIGYTVNVRRPPRYIGTFGPALNVEDTNETYSPVTLNQQFHVDGQFTTADLALSMDLFRTRVLKPMVAAVGNRVDADGTAFAYQNTAATLGTPGTSPSSFLVFALARAQLSNEAVPADSDLQVVLDPKSMAYATDGVKGLFNPQAQLGSYVQKGMVAKQFAGLNWFEDQNITSYTTGAGGGTPITVNAGSTTFFLTSGWSASGKLETSGWTNSTAVCSVGDVITIAGAFPVNPQSRRQYGNSLRQFVVLPPNGYLSNAGTATPGLIFAPATLTNGTFNSATGVYTSSGGGLLQLTLGGCCISGGQFQNVAAAPANGAAITLLGPASTVSPQNIAFHKNAFALAYADLPLPQGVQMAARAADKDIGMSIRLVTQYTINNDAEPTRCDVLYGYASLYRELAARIAG
jgi:hypothetical protein